MIIPFVTSIADANDLHTNAKLADKLSKVISKDPTKRLFRKDPNNIFYRKTWEYMYIYNQFLAWLKPNANVNAYGFGCGLERLPLYLAEHCSHVTATDAPPAIAKSCWKDSKQYLTGIEWYQSFRDIFGGTVDRISVEYHDMNSINLSIPKQDFIWSASSLEHLGTLDASFKFILDSSQLLSSNGIAVHCTEYNMSSDVNTRTEGDSVYFRARDILALHKYLDKAGFTMSPINLTNFHHPYNDYVDTPPYDACPAHMRVWFDGYILTSFGFCVRRKQ